MQLSFNRANDCTPSQVEQFKKALANKTTVVLNHSLQCGHCLAMRGEFDKFKSSTPHNVVEVEGSALGSLRQYPTIYKRIVPSDGSMYFPMILVFIKRSNVSTPKQYFYEGHRTHDALHSFIKEKEALETAKKTPANTPKKSSKATVRKVKSAPKPLPKKASSTKPKSQRKTI